MHTTNYSPQHLDGAVLASAPHSLTLTFAQEPLPGTTHVVAHTNTGELVQLPEPVIAGRVITVRWPTDRVAGTYEASWRLTSPDGHPVSGSWTFTYGLSKAQPISRETAQDERAASGPVVLVVVSSSPSHFGGGRFGSRSSSVDDDRRASSDGSCTPARHL